NYILSNDLDESTSDYNANADATTNNGMGWLRGGYMGGITIDGKGFSIADLEIDRSDNWENGLFSYLYNSTIKNITVKDFNIFGSGYTGFFAGYADNVIFESVRVKNGNVNSRDYGGLLAGTGFSVTIKNSSAEGQVSGDYFMGGFLG